MRQLFIARCDNKAAPSSALRAHSIDEANALVPYPALIVETEDGGGWWAFELDDGRYDMSYDMPANGV